MALPQGNVLPGAEHGDGDGVDHISGLPDDLLLKVLAGLGSVREAARTGVLSSRWCGLWTRLSAYTFSGVEPGAVEAALAQLTLPALDRLNIQALLTSCDTVLRTASLLRAAARLSIESVSVLLMKLIDGDSPAIELPCFGRTSSLVLKGYYVPFAPPPAGEFSRLERLELETGCNIFTALLPNCPRLRVLRIHGCEALEVTVHSTTLEVLAVECALCFESGTRRIDIDTPELKESHVEVDVGRGLSLSFSAPKVENHGWKFRNLKGKFDGFHIPLGGLLGCSLEYGVSTLRWDLDCAFISWPVSHWSWAQEIEHLPMADFSVLEIIVHTQGHAFGSLLFHMVQNPPTIQKLEVFIYQNEMPYDEWCPEDCPCRQLIDWKNETLSLFDLKEVHISYAFTEGNEEVDFLKLLFRSAPGLKRMDVVVDNKLHEEIRGICGENSHVKCGVR